MSFTRKKYSLIFLVITGLGLWPADGFGQWSKINLRSDSAIVSDVILDVFFINSDTGFLATDQGVLYKTVNGGYNWSFDTLAAGGSIGPIFFVTDQVGYIKAASPTYFYGEILKTTDGGVNWTNPAPDFTAGASEAIYFFNPDIGMIGGASAVSTTFDGGVNWSTNYNVGSGEIHDIRFMGGNYLD